MKKFIKILKEKAKGQVIKRDIVISMTSSGDKVGVYIDREFGEEFLFECSPRTADKLLLYHNLGINGNLE
jgi:hypothetical protein